MKTLETKMEIATETKGEGGNEENKSPEDGFSSH